MHLKETSSEKLEGIQLKITRPVETGVMEEKEYLGETSQSTLRKLGWLEETRVAGGNQCIPRKLENCQKPITT